MKKVPETYDWNAEINDKKVKDLRVRLLGKNAAASGSGAQYVSYGKERKTVSATLRSELAIFALEKVNNVMVADKSRGPMNVARLMLVYEPLTGMELELMTRKLMENIARYVRDEKDGKFKELTADSRDKFKAGSRKLKLTLHEGPPPLDDAGEKLTLDLVCELQEKRKPCTFWVCVKSMQKHDASFRGRKKLAWLPFEGDALVLRFQASLCALYRETLFRRPGAASKLGGIA